jgi:hypothetical protein
MFEEEVIKYWEEKGIKFSEDIPTFILKETSGFMRYVRLLYPQKYIVAIELLPYNSIMIFTRFFYFEGEPFAIVDIEEKMRKKYKSLVINLDGGEIEKRLQISNRKGVYRLLIVLPIKEFLPTETKELINKAENIAKEVFNEIKKKGVIYFPYEEKYLEKVSVFLPKV